MQSNISDEEYSGFHFENGYIRLIDDLIKNNLISNIFERPNCLILLEDKSDITYYIKEEYFIDLYNDLKRVIAEERLSTDLMNALASLKKWIERAYHNSNRVTHSKLFEYAYAYKITEANKSIINYPQITDTSLRWSQDEYSFCNLR